MRWIVCSSFSSSWCLKPTLFRAIQKSFHKPFIGPLALNLQSVLAFLNSLEFKFLPSFKSVFGA